MFNYARRGNLKNIQQVIDEFRNKPEEILSEAPNF